MITYKIYFAVVTLIIAVITVLVNLNVINVNIDNINQVATTVWTVLVALGLAVDKVQSDNPSSTALKMFKKGK
jgi:hypothetical protein